MRLLQIAVPTGMRDAVEQKLVESDVDYFLTDEISRQEYAALVFVPAATEDVEALMDELRETGVQKEGYVTVGKLEVILSDRFEHRQSEQVAPEAEAEETSGRIAREELQARAAEIAPITPTYLLFTILSTVIATAGLLMNSAAVVVGSMVIAPLIGPAIATSVGSILNDEELFRTSIKAQFVGVVLAVVSAAIFAGMVRVTFLPELQIQLIEQVAERVNPSALALVVALGAGVAGAVSLTSTTSIALVGVAIAVALIPPAATVGLGLAYGDITAAVSAGILVCINVLSINVASLGTLWMQGYRPEHWFAEQEAKRDTIRRAAVLAAIVLILSSALAVTTLNISENAKFERTVSDIASEADGHILSLDVSYRTELFFRHPSAVTIHLVGGSPETANELRSQIASQTQQDVTVIVIREEGEISTAQQLRSPTMDRLMRSSSQPEIVAHAHRRPY